MDGDRGRVDAKRGGDRPDRIGRRLRSCPDLGARSAVRYGSGSVQWLDLRVVEVVGAVFALDGLRGAVERRPDFALLVPGASGQLDIADGSEIGRDRLPVAERIRWRRAPGHIHPL